MFINLFIGMHAKKTNVRDKKKQISFSFKF